MFVSHFYGFFGCYFVFFFSDEARQVRAVVFDNCSNATLNICNILSTMRKLVTLMMADDLNEFVDPSLRRTKYNLVNFRGLFRSVEAFFLKRHRLFLCFRSPPTTNGNRNSNQQIEIGVCCLSSHANNRSWFNVLHFYIPNAITKRHTD